MKRNVQHRNVKVAKTKTVGNARGTIRERCKANRTFVGGVEFHVVMERVHVRSVQDANPPVSIWCVDSIRVVVLLPEIVDPRVGCIRSRLEVQEVDVNGVHSGDIFGPPRM
jgi:hypothetical protein